MLLSKSVLAALIATAAGGIVIGSATTYVVVNNNECDCWKNWKGAEFERQAAPGRKWARTPTNLSDDEGGKRITTHYEFGIEKPKRKGKENGDSAKE